MQLPYLDEHVEVGEGSGCESETDEQHQDSDEDLATASLAHHRDGGDQAAAMETKLVVKSADGEFEAKTSQARKRAELRKILNTYLTSSQ